MKTFVMIPTYNERENIQALIKDIFNLGIEGINVVVVDDNSPDRTWEVIEKMSQDNPAVHLLKRMKKRGRGYAGVDGLMYCIKEGADYIVEMDGDFSHDPVYLKDMIREIESCDVVTASRFIKGGGDSERGSFRNLVSRFASVYARILLGVNIKDPSLGFRLFRRKVLVAIDLEDIISIGPSIVLEMIYKIHLKGFKIKEIPVRFANRRHGSTKLDFLMLLETLLMVLRLRRMRKQGRIT